MKGLDFTGIWGNYCQVSLSYWRAMASYANEFSRSTFEALEPLVNMERKKAVSDPGGQWKDFQDLTKLNKELGWMLAVGQ